MILYKQHIIFNNQDARSALKALETLRRMPQEHFLCSTKTTMLVGVITDGDIRRGLLDGSEISDPATRVYEYPVQVSEGIEIFGG
jgi:hypothetical protein